MNVRRVARGIRAGGLAAIIAFNVIIPAEAEETIGVAAVVRNQVDQALPTRVIPINIGEHITRDEVVKTGMESAAKLVFSDNTNLSMGPGSAVTLNKFVYSGASSYEKATFQLAKGAFRFTTGASDKRAYEIRTPTATIGVRGTILDIRVDPLTFNTLVLLQEGAADVCIVSTRRDREKGGNAARCQHLTQVGQTATATSTSVSNSGPGGAGGWNFSIQLGKIHRFCSKLFSRRPLRPAGRMAMVMVIMAARREPSGRWVTGPGASAAAVEEGPFFRRREDPLLVRTNSLP